MGDLEAALQLQGESRQPEQYFDPISLGGLIVSVATFAWNVYKDLRTHESKPSRDAVARRIRVALRQVDAPNPEKQDLLVEVVVDELMRAAEEDAD